MATAAVAVMAKARRDVVSHFMSANAISPESAVAYEPGLRSRQRQFERLCDTGIVRTANDGRYWVDAPRFDKWSRSRRRRIGLAVGAVALFGAVAAMLAG